MEKKEMIPDIQKIHFLFMANWEKLLSGIYGVCLNNSPRHGSNRLIWANEWVTMEIPPTGSIKKNATEVILFMAELA